MSVGDATAPGAAPGPSNAAATPWYRRRGVIVGAAIAAVLAVAVITDIPAPTSRSSNIAAAKAVIDEVNTDLAPCANATGEAYQLYSFKVAGTITPDEQSGSSRWLSDDLVACSFANAQVFDLSDVEVPGTASGKQLAQMVGWVTQWATSDALNSMNAISILMTHPANAQALASLSTQWRAMEKDRASATGAVRTVEGMLDTTLPALVLPSVPEPTSLAAT